MLAHLKDSWYSAAVPRPTVDFRGLVVEESAAVAHDSDSATPVSFPLRVILELVVIGLFAGIGVEGAVAVLRATRLTQSQRLIALGAIVVIMGLLAVMVTLLGSGYWD